MLRTEDQHIRHYAFRERDFSILGQDRGAASHLGFAVQLFTAPIHTEHVPSASNFVNANANATAQLMLRLATSVGAVGMTESEFADSCGFASHLSGF